MSLAPIALFVYKRPLHVRRVIHALQCNDLSAKSNLFVFSDGPRTEADWKAVGDLREFLRTVKGFRNVTVVERSENIGLAGSIIAGVTETVHRFGRIIVLEDDMVTSPFFLKYMNEALDLYETDPSVVSIHGYMYPVPGKLPETFFLRGADCWGWATWKRGWDLFEPDGQKLLGEIRRKKLQRAFDINGAYPYTKMLKDQINAKNDSWAIRWYASAYLKEKLTLYPGRSLVQNIGMDQSGTHSIKTNYLDTEICSNPIEIRKIPFEHSTVALKEIEIFLKKNRSPLRRLAFSVMENIRK